MVDLPGAGTPVSLCRIDPEKVKREAEGLLKRAAKLIIRRLQVKRESVFLSARPTFHELANQCVATSDPAAARRLRNSSAKFPYASAPNPVASCSKIDFPWLGASPMRIVRGIIVAYI